MNVDKMRSLLIMEEYFGVKWGNSEPVPLNLPKHLQEGLDRLMPKINRMIAERIKLN